MAATAKAILQSPAMKPLTKCKAWGALKAHYKTVQALHLRKLFDEDPKRGEWFTAEALGIYLDFSKNRITDKTLKLLLELAGESGLRERIDAIFRGEKINITENRAVLHVTLRATKDETILVDGKNVVPEVHAVPEQMAAFCNRVRSCEWKGHAGKRIRLENRRARPARGLRESGGSCASGRPRQRRLHHPGPWSGRQKVA